MRILYGIAGEGLGHAVRSSVIIEELLDRGHEVRIVVSGAASDYVRRKFSEVTEIWGFSIVTRNNQLHQTRTIASNVRNGLAPSGLPRNIYKGLEVAREFDPDVVVSDHELWSWFFATFHDIPILGLDNIHLLSRCEHPPAVIDGLLRRYPFQWIFVKGRVPTAHHYLVSTFAWPTPSKPNTTLVPPILRPSILEATPSDGDHLLVYQNSYLRTELVSKLRTFEMPVRIYSTQLDADDGYQTDNLTFRPFSESQFIDDLASCRAVLGTAGFTLMTEALHLGKPYFAIPIDGQIEQMLNARYLDWLGYGTYAVDPHRGDIEQFFRRLPEFRDAIVEYERHDNEPTFEQLEDLIERYAAPSAVDRTGSPTATTLP